MSSLQSEFQPLLFFCRNLVKNLLLGYLTAPAARRDDVLRPVASIFGFTGAELNKVCSEKEYFALFLDNVMVEVMAICSASVS